MNSIPPFGSSIMLVLALTSLKKDVSVSVSHSDIDTCPCIYLFIFQIIINVVFPMFVLRYAVLG